MHMHIVSFQKDAHAHVHQWSTIILNTHFSNCLYELINNYFLLEQFTSKFYVVNTSV